MLVGAVKFVVVCIVALCGVASADPSTGRKEITVRYKTATASEPGYEEASMRFEYLFTVCSGEATLLYRLVERSLEVGEWYRYDGERHLVSDVPAPKGASSPPFKGVIKGAGKPVTFHDTSPITLGGGCGLGQQKRFGKIKDILGNAADKDDIERYLDGLSLEVERANWVVRNSDIESRVRAEKQKAIKDEQDRLKKIADDKKKADDDKKKADAAAKKAEDDKKALEAEIKKVQDEIDRKERERIEKIERDRANETPKAPDETKPADESKPADETKPPEEVKPPTVSSSTTTTSTTKNGSTTTTTTTKTMPPPSEPYEPARATEKPIARDMSSEDEEAMEWLNDNTLNTSTNGYDCGYSNWARLSQCSARSYSVTFTEYGISTLGYTIARNGSTIAWRDVVGINITDMGRVRVIWGPRASSGDMHVVYITPKSGVDLDRYAFEIQGLTGSSKRLVVLARMRDYDGHEDEGEDRKQAAAEAFARMTPEQQFGVVAGSAAIAISDALDRAKIWPQHAITLTRDGFGSSGEDVDGGTPGPSSTLLAMSYCRVWGAQLGFGSATTGVSESTVTDNDYRTQGMLSFYDKGAFMTAGAGFCLPNRFVQPYFLGSFDLPLGGERVQVGQAWEMTDGDVSGFRSRATAGVNFRFGKLPIGVGIRASYTHVHPSVTLVDDPDGSGSTWGAEGGGASYFSLGLQVAVYPFRSHDP